MLKQRFMDELHFPIAVVVEVVSVVLTVFTVVVDVILLATVTVVSATVKHKTLTEVKL
jgi:hypothetical protein